MRCFGIVMQKPFLHRDSDESHPFAKRVLLYLCHPPTPRPFLFQGCLIVSPQPSPLSTKKKNPNVSLISKSHSLVWFITDLTHRLTSVGDVRVEGPAEGKFIKTSHHQNRNLLWGNSRQHEQPCLFTVGLWKCALCHALFFGFSFGGLWSEG